MADPVTALKGQRHYLLLDGLRCGVGWLPAPVLMRQSHSGLPGGPCQVGGSQVKMSGVTFWCGVVALLRHKRDTRGPSTACWVLLVWSFSVFLQFQHLPGLGVHDAAVGRLKLDREVNVFRVKFGVQFARGIEPKEL
jgi:hypothetical protein